MNNLIEKAKDFLGIGFKGYLERLTITPGLSSVSVTLMRAMGGYQCLGLDWEADSGSGRPIRFKETLVRWTAYEQAGWDKSLPPGYFDRFLITVDNKISDVKSKVPAVSISVRLLDEDRNKLLSQKRIQQLIRDAKQKQAEPF